MAPLLAAALFACATPLPPDPASAPTSAPAPGPTRADVPALDLGAPVALEREEDPFAGWCPDPRDVDTVPYEFFTVNPCVLDPTISLCSPDPVTWPDTHEQGLRLHRIGQRTDLAELRPELLLFLPPGPGESNNRLLQWGAYAGFRTISLGWQNEFRVERCGDDSQCHEDARYELAWGEDHNAWLDVWPADSLVGRLETLLRHLIATRPTEGWERYYTDPEGVRWDRVVLMGWSQGASEAAWLARDVEVDGLVLISGPKEPVFDPVSQTLTVAEWLSDPRATPACRQLAIYHRDEALVGPPPGFDVCEASFLTLGLPEPIVDSDASSPPYGGASILNTAKTGFQQPWCDPHQAMGMDQCMHESLVQPYLYLMCSAADRDDCP